MKKVFLLSVLILTLASCYTDKMVKVNKADLHHQIGIGHMQKGNYPDALNEFLKAEELNPKSPSLLNNIALVYFLREKFDLSELYFKKALALDPNYTDAKNNYARLLIETKKYKEAEELLLESLKDLTYPNYTKIYNNIGFLYFLQNRHLESQGYLKKSLEKNKDDCFAIYYYGLTSFNIENFKSSSAALDVYIKKCDQTAKDEPFYFSALSHYRLKNSSMALQRFEELIKKYPNGKYNEKSRKMAELIKKGN